MDALYHTGRLVDIIRLIFDITFLKRIRSISDNLLLNMNGVNSVVHVLTRLVRHAEGRRVTLQAECQYIS